MNITFIGLGIMGSRMATHLITNGVNLTVYNRTLKSTTTLKEKGANVSESIQNAVKGADIVFSMLSTPEIVEDIFFGNEKVLSSMKKNAMWVDCTTVNPSFSLKSFEEAKKYNVKFIDAPVAGSKPQAENAELAFFVGGKKETIDTIEPYLKIMGSKVLHIGNTGKGSSFKMIVNMMLAQSMLIFSEAVLLGEKIGISKDFLLETLPNSPVSAPFTKFKAKSIQDNIYDVQFPLEWMLKDLHLADITANENNHSLCLSPITKDIYTKANKDGMGRLDFSAIYKYLEKNKIL